MPPRSSPNLTSPVTAVISAAMIAGVAVAAAIDRAAVAAVVAAAIDNRPTEAPVTGGWREHFSAPYTEDCLLSVASRSRIMSVVAALGGCWSSLSLSPRSGSPAVGTPPR
jgi:hypothetical protein